MQEGQFQEPQIERSVESQQESARKHENYSKQKSVGLWSDHEHQKYIIFIDFFKRELNSKRYRRNNRVFKSLSDFIQSRSPIQCRSHHTKLMRTFRNIPNIIKDFKKQIGSEEYIEAKKLLTSGHKLFQNEQKLNKSSRASGDPKKQLRMKNAGVQTDFTIAPNATILQSQNFSLSPNFGMVPCPGPFFWFLPQ